jgi:hypothetical protein
MRLTKKNLFARLARRVPIYGDILRINDTLGSVRQALFSVERQIQSQHNFSVIRLLDFELGGHPRYGDPKRLLRYAFQGCSQNGEDGMIREIFRRIGLADKIFCEIGVGSGNENNTAFLISQGWRGYWLDGCEDFLKTVETRGWEASGIVKAARRIVSRENVSEILVSLGVPSGMDFLSIDVDQNTFHIWQALSGFRPRVVAVEYNAAFPPDMEWVVEYSPTAVWDGSQNYGASLKSFELLGNQFGYSLVGCDFVGVNAFFVRKDLCGDKFSAPFTAENHFEPLRYSALCLRGHPQKAFDAPVT